MSGSSVPNAVTALAAGTPTTTTIPVSWTAPATGPAPTGYNVDVSPAGQNNWTNAATGVTATTYTVSGLTPATSYDIRVTPTDSAGAGQASVLPGTTTAAVPATTPLTDTGYFGASITEGLHRAAFMVSEARGYRSRERATITNAGASAILFPAGLVVAVSGGPGAYTLAPYTATTTAGTQAGVLYDNRMVQPNETLPVTLVAREAEVNFAELQFDASITSGAQQATLRNQLAAAMIICR